MPTLALGGQELNSLVPLSNTVRLAQMVVLQVILWDLPTTTSSSASAHKEIIYDR